MLSKQPLNEIRVYEDFAERTGVQVERNEVRRSEGYCRSMTQLLRKARASGDGTFYLSTNLWPADTDRLALKKTWVVMSSLQ